MSRCSKSRDMWYNLFGKHVYGIDLCVPATYDKAYYRFRIKDKSGKKIVDATRTKEIKFTKEESKLVKSICEYKKKFDGRGDDPKCISTSKELRGGSKKIASKIRFYLQLVSLLFLKFFVGWFDSILECPKVFDSSPIRIIN